MEQRRTGIRIDPSDLALEIVSTGLAILLALAVNHWQEDRTRGRILHESLVNVRREIAENRAVLMQKMPLHRRVRDVITLFAEKHVRDGNVTFGQLFVVFHGSTPQGFQVVRGVDIAWQIAQSTQALADMPYDLRSALTRTYDAQSGLYGAETRFIDAAFSSGAASKDYFAQAFGASLWLNDVVFDETALLGDYDRALGSLPKT